MDLLDRLLEHDCWATETLLNVSRELSDAQLDQPFDIGHRTLRSTFEHFIPNVDFWTRLMEGQPPTSPQDGLSVDLLIDEHERNYTAFATLARRIRDEGRWDDTFIDHYDMPQTFGSAILMVILHNTEHRTEVAHILQRLGVPEVPEVDPGLWDFVRRGLYQPG
jgi:uncharacterized damage-inducible protein DinB